ncbi:MAG: hypothetical protein JXA87_15545 [Thermoleophilia bacterium]|nr:hypothetical protein [Thermoleophilia bacterium]
MTLWAAHPGTLRTARWVARAAVVLALVVFVVTLLWANNAPWFLDLWRAVLVVTVVGCWSLSALAALSQTRTTERSCDFVLVLIALALGLFSAFLATDEGGSDLFFEIGGALAVLGGIALIVASAAGKRRAQQWRNT